MKLMLVPRPGTCVPHSTPLLSPGHSPAARRPLTRRPLPCTFKQPPYFTCCLWSPGRLDPRKMPTQTLKAAHACLRQALPGRRRWFFTRGLKVGSLTWHAMSPSSALALFGRERRQGKGCCPTRSGAAAGSLLHRCQPRVTRLWPKKGKGYRFGR